MKHERQTILGQPPSKSNQYRIITMRGHGSLAKTQGMKQYEESFFLQCGLRGRGIAKRFALRVDVYFRSDLPDLDNSLKVVLDCLQACGAIKNDRLCAEITARKLVDKQNPRVEFEIEELL